MKRLFNASCVLSFLLVCLRADATVYQFTGTYTANYSGGPVSSMVANFQFNFDDSVVVPVGNQLYNNLPMTSFSMTPSPLGSTTFTSANTGGALYYTNGVLSEVIVGGLVDGANTIFGASTQDDFYFDHNLTTNIVNGVHHVPPFGVLGSGGNGTATLSITVIPEPAALLVLLLGVVPRRRHR